MFFSWLSCDCHVTVLPLCRLLTKWARALQSTLSDLQEYIKTYHTIGPSWNPEVCTVGGVCCRGCVCGWVCMRACVSLCAHVRMHVCVDEFYHPPPHSSVLPPDLSSSSFLSLSVQIVQKYSLPHVPPKMLRYIINACRLPACACSIRFLNPTFQLFTGVQISLDLSSPHPLVIHLSFITHLSYLYCLYSPPLPPHTHTFFSFPCAGS